MLAFRCQQCKGPVPYDLKEGDLLNCMRCEHVFLQSRVPSIVEQFYATQRLIWLTQSITTDKTVDQLEEITLRMNLLSGLIYHAHAKWLQIVREFCELLFECNSYREAVDWFQWYVDQCDIYLCEYEDQTQNERLTQLDQWTNAYLVRLFEMSTDYHEDKGQFHYKATKLTYS